MLGMGFATTPYPPFAKAKTLKNTKGNENENLNLRTKSLCNSFAIFHGKGFAIVPLNCFSNCEIFYFTNSCDLLVTAKFLS